MKQIKFREEVNNGEKKCYAPEDCYWRISDTNICTSPDECTYNLKTNKVITAEEYWQKRNGGKPSEKATKHFELYTPTCVVLLMEDYHKEVLRSELIAYDKWMCKTYWGENIIKSAETVVDEYLKSKK